MLTARRAVTLAVLTAAIFGGGLLAPPPSDASAGPANQLHPISANSIVTR